MKGDVVADPVDEDQAIGRDPFGGEHRARLSDFRVKHAQRIEHLVAPAVVAGATGEDVLGLRVGALDDLQGAARGRRLLGGERPGTDGQQTREPRSVLQHGSALDRTWLSIRSSPL